VLLHLLQRLVNDKVLSEAVLTIVHSDRGSARVCASDRRYGRWTLPDARQGTARGRCEPLVL